MRKFVNGQYLDLTEEDEAVLEEAIENTPIPDESDLADKAEAYDILTGGAE